MVREIFKIKNNTSSDIELIDFGIIIPPSAIVELDDYDKAVLSDELYTLLTNSSLLRIINGEIVTDINNIYSAGITTEILQNYTPTGHTHLNTDITDLNTYYYNKTQNNALLLGKANTSHDQSVSTITDINTYYYNKTQIESGLQNYTPTGHTHLNTDITDLNTYYYNKIDTNSLLTNKANTTHEQSVSTITDLSTYYYNKNQSELLLTGSTLKINQILSTGLISGGLLTCITGGTTFNLSSGYGYIVDNYTDSNNPIITKVSWNDFSGVTDLHINETLNTHIAIDINGHIVQQIELFSVEQTRDYIILGKTTHTDKASITATVVAPITMYDTQINTYDILYAIDVINISGNKFTENATYPLHLDKSEGIVFRTGSNYENSTKSPNIKNTPAHTNLFFKYRYRGTSGFTTSSYTNVVDTTHWDDNTGVLATVQDTTTWTIQRIYYFSSDKVYITYGQHQYTSYLNAKLAFSTEIVDVDPEFKEASLCAYMILKKNATTLVDSNNMIIYANKFGESGGGGSVIGTNIDTPYLTTHNTFSLFSGTTGTVLKSTTATCDDNGNANFLTLSENGNLISNKYSLTGHTHTWNQLDKTISSIGDLTNRNIDDIRYTNTKFDVTSAKTYLDIVGDYCGNMGTGILSPLTNILTKLDDTRISVASGIGYISTINIFRQVNWNSNTIDFSGLTRSIYYIYIDINSNVHSTPTIIDGNNNIIMGGLYFDGYEIIAIMNNGRYLSNFSTRVADFTSNLGAFVYDNGLYLQRVGNSGDSALQLYCSRGSIQWQLRQFNISEIYSTNINTITIKYTTLDDWNDDLLSIVYNNGKLNTTRYNDITQNKNILSNYNYTFTNGSSVVTCTTDLTSIINTDHLIRLHSDNYRYNCPVSAVTWSGSLTTITLEFNYLGSNGTGNAYVDKSTPLMTDGKYRKDLVIRTVDNKMEIFIGQQMFDTLDLAKTGAAPANIPDAIAFNAISIAYCIVAKNDTSINTILDVRPIPFIASKNALGSGSANVVQSHNSLTGLLNDDHPQYLKSDATRLLTNILSYNTNFYFTNDNQIISKKYVDDSLLTRSVTGHTHLISDIIDIEDFYYNKTDINYILTNYVNSASTTLDSRYYTKSDISNILVPYTTTGHTQLVSSITDIQTYYYTKTDIDNMHEMFNTGNTYTKSDINDFFSGTTGISGYNKTQWDISYVNQHTHSNKIYLEAVGNNTIWNTSNLNKNNVSLITNKLTIHTNVGENSIVAGSDNGNTKLVINSIGGGVYINNNTDNVYLANTGNVGINTTTFDTINPEKLIVSSSNQSKNLIRGISNYNNYTQFNLTNINSGTSASSDFVSTANNGTETTYFIDMGINSSNYSDPTFTVTGANDSYLYNEGGNLVIGTATSNKSIKFFTEGTLTNNVKMIIDHTGNIGINTQLLTTTSKLQINDGLTKGGTFTNLLSLRNDDSTNRMELLISRSSNDYWSIQSLEQGVSNKVLALNPAGGNVTISGYTIWHQGNFNPLSKANSATTIAGYNISDAYTITQTNTLLAGKANSATTIAGYNISDAYTITQTNNLLNLKLNTSGGTISGSLTINNNLNINSGISVSGVTTFNNDILALNTTVYNYNTPTTSALSSINSGYSHMYVFGSGVHVPQLGNITTFNINWDLTLNSVYTFSFGTTDGIPSYYTNLIPLLTQNFNQTKPSMTLSGTGIANFDGSYWVTLSGTDFIMVSKTGLFSIYCTNNNNYINPATLNPLLAYDSTKKLVNSGFIPTYHGQNYQYAISGGTVTSNSTIYFTYLTLVTTNLTYGTYKISSNCIVSHTATNNSVTITTALNGTQINSGMTWYPGNILERQIYSTFYITNLSGRNTITIQFKNSAGSSTIYNGIIELVRVI